MEINKLTKHYWIWPIALYLFLGGLGGGMLFVCGLMDIGFSDMLTNVGLRSAAAYGGGYAWSMAVFAAVALLGIGTFLLVFELGQWKVFVRVFIGGTAIIKWGAVMLVFAMLFGFVYFLFYLPPQWNLFFYSWTWLRDLSCVCMMVLGLGIMVYTGVLLSTMKSKPFWNTPALPVLFTVSALSTATALIAVMAGIWPASDYVAAMYAGGGADAVAEYAPATLHVATEFVVEQMHFYDSILIIAEIVVILIYVLTMRAAGNVTAKAIAIDWIQGKKALPFWGGLLGCGMIIPFLFYRLGGVAGEMLAPVLVLAAGCLLRFMIVYSDQRRPIPGEERYYNRLPHGDEAFLSRWKEIS
jgi:polysulfide reductase chain C